MKTRRSSLKKVFLIGGGGMALLVILGIGGIYAFFSFAMMPVEDGGELGGGAVQSIVTDRMGPVPITAYIVDLDDGNVALVDTGLDPEATKIRAALAAAGHTPENVEAIFYTHEHDDHAAGTQAFPHVDIYAFESYAGPLRSFRAEIDSISGETHSIGDGDVIDISGTEFHIFSIPGHTPGSIAILVHGVLFLGDSAGSGPDGTMAPNSLMGDDPEQNEQSLLRLAERLKPLRDEIQALAFGHHGAIEGPDPLFDWAATTHDPGR